METVESSGNCESAGVLGDLLGAIASGDHVRLSAIVKNSREAINRRGSEEADLPIIFAVRRGNLDAVRILLDNGADPDVFDSQGDKPVHIAANLGNTDILRLILLSDKKGLNQQQRGSGMLTPLHLAARGDHLDTASYLIRDAKAELEPLNKNRRTPLHTAARHGSVDVLELLVSSGAKVDSRDMHDNTPLHLAARFGGYQVSELLMRKGASPHLKNKFGNTPLVSAKKCGKDLASPRLGIGSGECADSLGAFAESFADLAKRFAQAQEESGRRSATVVERLDRSLALSELQEKREAAKEWRESEQRREDRERGVMGRSLKRIRGATFFDISGMAVTFGCLFAFLFDLGSRALKSLKGEAADFKDVFSSKRFGMALFVFFYAVLMFLPPSGSLRGPATPEAVSGSLPPRSS